MSSSDHPFLGLVGPLRYASAQNFANLQTVKGLTGLLEAAVARAQPGAVAPAALEAVRAELPAIDSPDASARKASVERLLRTLQQLGLMGNVASQAGAPRSAAEQAFVDSVRAGAAGSPPPQGELALPTAAGRSSAVRSVGAIDSRTEAAQSPVARPVGVVAASTSTRAAPSPAAQTGVATAARQGPATVQRAGAVPFELIESPSAPLEATAPARAGRAASALPASSAKAQSSGAGPSSSASAAPSAGRRARGSTRSSAAVGPQRPAAAAPVASEAAAAAPARKKPERARKAPATARAPTKKKGPTEADSPTRLLSIAPSAGPLSTPLKDVGWRLNPRLVGLLNRKGVHKVGDVLFLLPRVYEDRRHLKHIAQLVAGERGTTVAVVQRAEEQYGRNGRRTFRAVLADSSGSIGVTYFQTGPWLKAKFPVGHTLVISGEVRHASWGWEIAHPEVEPADDLQSSPIHFNRIVPVYPGFERHEQRSLRELAYKISARFSADLEEPLPDELRQKLGLLDITEAIRRIHFPPQGEDLAQLDSHQSAAHHRLAFDELFFLQLGMALRRQGVKVQPGIAFDTSEPRLARARALLPFALTGAQQRVVQQLSRDMARPEPMNRLVQGDVGSGKTAVALMATALALQDGYQVAVMAPTEILAEQHLRTFARLLEPLGAKVALITGGGGAKERRVLREGLASGQLQVAVGTHALIEQSVDFHRLGLVVIDEQHRFGVIQRHALMAKGVRPDVLVMTATPIPRTLAMTLYGDLDVSVIDELPPGRTPIATRVFVEKARAHAYQSLQAELAQGRQAYVVYPLVEESEKLDLADATQGAAKLAAIFPTARIGLLHGRLKNDEKEAVMTAFRAHELDVLVCTTVVEVGVDVPNASVMLIESAERFGLSQLHQLRGRVGRGAAQSYCFLMTGYAKSEEARERLAVMEQSNDGFVIAEKDLELRGPGEFLGTRQSGVPELAVANLGRDQALLATAQDEARAIVGKDPHLERPEHARLVKALEERWEGRLKLARVG